MKWTAILVIALLAVVCLYGYKQLGTREANENESRVQVVDRGESRQRVAFQQLSAAAQDKAKACEKISKQLEAASVSERPVIAGQLRGQAREITTANPDFFLGWVWLAQAALVLDERGDGNAAGANMAALGAAENRSPWIQSLILSLGKKGWIPSQTVVAVAETRVEGQPNSQSPSLNANDRLEFDTLGQLAIAAEQEPDGAKRREATDQFLAQSKTFLSNHPDEIRLWLLRGHLCARDDRREEGMEAASNLKRLGVVQSNNPAVHQVVAELNLKGWLHEAPSARVVSSATPSNVTPSGVDVLPEHPNWRDGYRALTPAELTPFVGEWTLTLPGEEYALSLIIAHDGTVDGTRAAPGDRIFFHQGYVNFTLGDERFKVTGRGRDPESGSDTLELIWTANDGDTAEANAVKVGELAPDTTLAEGVVLPVDAVKCSSLVFGSWGTSWTGGLSALRCEKVSFGQAAVYAVAGVSRIKANTGGDGDVVFLSDADYARLIDSLRRLYAQGQDANRRGVEWSSQTPIVIAGLSEKQSPASVGFRNDSLALVSAGGMSEVDSLSLTGWSVADAPSRYGADINFKTSNMCLSFARDDLPRLITFLQAIQVQPLQGATAATDAHVRILHVFDYGGADGLAAGRHVTFDERTRTLYGTVEGGSGIQQWGLVYAVSVSDGIYRVLHVFQRENRGGAIPTTGVVPGDHGQLYGGLGTFGTDDGGGLFMLAPDGKYTVLRHFSPLFDRQDPNKFPGIVEISNRDGLGPDGKMVLDRSGTLYGVSATGGANKNGTVFALTAAGTFAVLHTFSASESLRNLDGETPLGLAIDGTGNLYGTTEVGGAYGQGTIYRINPRDGRFETLYAFPSGKNDDGRSAPTLDRRGNLYGTTGNNGIFEGAVYTLTQDGVMKVLHTFTNAKISDGLGLASGVAVRDDGTLYGTTCLGGRNGKGTIFRMTTQGEDFAVLHSFRSETEGEVGRDCDLALDDEGALYGTTGRAGLKNGGTLFKLEDNAP